MYSRKDLVDKLDEFLENKNAAKSSIKDYKVDCMTFIKWYSKHRDIEDGLLYNSFLKALDNSDLSHKTKKRKKIIIGEFLVYIGAFSSSHIIVKNERNIIKYYDVNECKIIMQGREIHFYKIKN